tara:strand:- start:3109 stop:4749 length:1641 start_codon:yes stop_codon:yes gene_type:complete
MPAIITSNFRTLNAKHFKEQISGSSVYVGIGKSDPWSLTTSDTTDTTPFTPSDRLDDLGEARANLIGLKKIVAADIAHVVPRHTWTSGRSYVAWDSDDPDIFDKAFYIVTSEFKVYKCIIAGGGASSIQPTQTLTDPTAESDGYTWKFMYTISVTDAEKFLTNSYMPVKTVSLGATATVAVASSTTTIVLTETVPEIVVGMTVSGTNVGSGKTVSAINGSVLTLSGTPSGSVSGILTFAYANDAAAEASLSEADFAQYLNQKASRDSSTAAGIERIEVTAAGSSFSSKPNVVITGDGTGATVAAGNITMAGSGSSQTVSSITIQNKGSDYRFADISITGGGGSDATARAVIAPKAGHGVDPVAELGGFFISLNSKLDGNDGGDLTVGNDFRQITLFNEPRVFNSTPLAGLLATADTLKGTKALDFNSSANVSNYVIDELLVGGTSGAQAYVVEIDTSNGFVRYHQNSKTGYKSFTTGEVVTGQTSSNAGTLEANASNQVSGITYIADAVVAPEVDRHSGDILFLENRNPINRTTSQIEDIKVIIEF